MTHKNEERTVVGHGGGSQLSPKLAWSLQQVSDQATKVILSQKPNNKNLVKTETCIWLTNIPVQDGEKHKQPLDLYVGLKQCNNIIKSTGDEDTAGNRITFTTTCLPDTQCPSCSGRRLSVTGSSPPTVRQKHLHRQPLTGYLLVFQSLPMWETNSTR